MQTQCLHEHDCQCYLETTHRLISLFFIFPRGEPVRETDETAELIDDVIDGYRHAIRPAVRSGYMALN